MKKLKFFMLFCLFGSMLFAAQKTTKTVKNEYDLKFNPDKYVSKETEINGQKIKYRAYENIVYVKNPVDKDYQNMNIYIPEEYFNNSSIGSYNSNNAPIFFPNTVGGYMPGKADTVGLGRDGKANSLTYALSKGYVVAAPGARGRTLTDNKGNYTGKAPAAIVDLKAAVRYLYLNDEVMPGDANKIVSNGTSAGGALSALLGATGNSQDYLPYLQEIGAADTRDDIFAVSAYCPITNLENADTAYEWMYNGVNSYSRMVFSENTTAEEYNDRSLTHSTVQGNLTEDEICNICSNPKRDKSVITIVEDMHGVISLEKTKVYKGTYHILNGLVTPREGITLDDLNVNTLLDRIEKDNVKEVIFAISQTIDGELTELYIIDLLKKFKDLKISKIANGIPIGRSIDSYDELTFLKALEDRREIEY